MEPTGCAITKLKKKTQKWKRRTPEENQKCQAKSSEDELVVMMQRQPCAWISGE